MYESMIFVHKTNRMIKEITNEMNIDQTNKELQTYKKRLLQMELTMKLHQQTVYEMYLTFNTRKINQQRWKSI